MIAVTIVNIIAVLLTYLQRNNQIRYGFGIAIFLLICFYGIRYDYGNDYMAYFNNFQSINGQTNLELSTDSKDLELGWILLNRIFEPVGFFGLVFFLTIVQFYSFYRVATKYVPRNQQYIALGVYLFSSGLMLTMLSMMRQSLAMNIILWAVPALLNRKLLKSIIIIIIAAQFHRSAYIALSLPFVIYLFNLSKKTYVITIITIFILCFTAQSIITQYINELISSNFERYEAYSENESASLGSGIGFIFSILFFLTLVLSDRHKYSYESWTMKMLALSYVFIPLGFIIQLIGRLGLYFSILGIPAIGYLANMSKKSIYMKMIVTLYIFFMIYGYFTFFYSDVWIDKFMNYRTIFTHPHLN